MSRHFLGLVSLAALLLLVGCRHKTDASTELEKAVSALAQAEPTPPPPTPDHQPGTGVEVSALPPPAADAIAAPSASQQLKLAIVSYKTGQLEDAVTRLQKLRATPTLTAQQRMALQDSVAAVMGEVYELAAKGDARAIAAVRQYEQMQSAPRR